MTFSLRTLFTLALMLLTSHAHTQVTTASTGQTGWLTTDTIHSQLTSSHTQAQAGSTIQLAWHMRMDDKWHVYFSNPGDSGIPPMLVTSQPGLTIAPLAFPTPKVITIPPITNYGYENTAVFLTTLTLPASLPAGPIALPLTLQYLYCHEVCMPGEIATTLPLTIGSSMAPHPAFPTLLAQHQATLPQPLPAGTQLTAAKVGQTITLSGLSASAHFVPLAEGWLHDSAPQTFAGNTLTLQIDPHSTDLLTQVEGLLLLPDGTGRIVPPTPITTPAVHSTTGSPALLTALFFAFVAGLILNLMPCVLPVLSLKILGLVSSKHNPLPHTLAYTGGVLASFWTFAAVITALQAGGATLGWGFHLQNPPFVALLTTLMVVMALYFFGTFSVGAKATQLAGLGQSPNQSGGLRGAFLTGILAVVVATPCTVPFMGGAMAYALTQGPLANIAIFTAMGLGMAAPFFVITLVPALHRRLPRPGAWMIAFKHALGWPMLATALWLAFVFAQQTDTLALFVLLTLVLVTALATTLWGHTHGTTRRLIALILVVATTAFFAQHLSTRSTATTAWQPWSAAAVAQAQTTQPVFVDFTADWCITCKVTEATVLNTPSVQALFKERNVLLLKADWTKRDPAITAELAKHGRRGVPLYLLYLPGQPEPQILPQLLTLSTLKDALSNQL